MKHNKSISSHNKYLLELWHKSKSGDETAFGQLAESQYRTLFKHAFNNFTKDRDTIKDTIQDLFFHIWIHRETINMRFVSIYLIKALRNKFISRFRTNERKNKNLLYINSEDVEEIPDNNPDDAYKTEEEINTHIEQKIQELISLLPRRQQEAIVLKYYDGLDNEKIAARMQVNRQSVANLLYKAINTLKVSMPADIHLLFLLFFFNQLT